MTVLNKLVAAAAIVVATSASAGAAEVREVQEIKAAPAAVWAKVGGWCALKDWHPAVVNCDDSKKGLRTLYLKDGGKIVEKLVKTGKYSYTYAIVDSPLPVKDYTATFIAKPDSLGTTDLTWIANFAPKGKTEAEAVAVIKGIFTGGLKNIKDIVKFDAAPAAAAAAVPAAAAAAADAHKTAHELKVQAWKLKALEKAAKAKEEFAELRTKLLEKAKAAATAARAEYVKAKEAFDKASAAAAKAAVPAPAPTPAPAAPAKK